MLFGYGLKKELTNTWFGITLDAPWYVNQIKLVMLKPAEFTEFIAREEADYNANKDWIKLAPVVKYPFKDKMLGSANFGTAVEIIIMFIAWWMLLFPFPINLIGMIMFFICIIIYTIFGKMFHSRQKAVVMNVDD